MEVPNNFDWENFGVLDWRSLMGGGRLRGVVAHGGSTVAIDPCFSWVNVPLTN